MSSKNNIFNFFLLAFLLGIFINNIILDIYLSSLVLLFLVILFFNFYIYYKKFLIVILFIIFGFIFGVFLSDSFNSKIERNEKLLESYYDNNKYDLELKILDTYKIDTYNSLYIAKLLKLKDVEVNNDISLLINVPNNINIEKGYIFSSSSKLYKIDNFSDFDYKNYMLSKGIYFKLYLNSIDLISEGNINPLQKYLDDLRKELLIITHKIYPKEEALFLGGILLGARESLPNELKTHFNNSGLTHFIAVSGFNITILVIFFSFLFKYFPVFLRISLITTIIILFTLLVGDTAPVIRASIMGLIGYYILNSGRKGDVWTIVLLTAFIMLLLSPLSLNYDISFHLSFLAVLGIVFTQSFFKKIFYFLPETLAIREAFVLTFSATAFALPVMMFNFGQVSLISPLANVAITWTIPFAMLFGFLSILAYFIDPAFGFIVGYIDFIFLRYDMLVVHFFGSMDGMLLKFDFGIYKNYLEILYFVLLAFVVMYFRGNKKEE